MGIWKKLTALIVTLVISSTAGAGYAITERKVAVLPPINTAQYRYAEDIQIIQDTIKKPFKYPYYILISADIAAKASKELISQNNKLKLSDERVLAMLADKLDADIVVVMELSRARFELVHTWDFGETYVESDVELKCYSYSSATKKYLVLKASKYGRECESIDTNADITFKNLTEDILQKLPYKRIPDDVKL